MIAFKAMAVVLVGLGSFTIGTSLQQPYPYAAIGVFTGIASIGLGLLIVPAK